MDVLFHCGHRTEHCFIYFTINTLPLSQCAPADNDLTWIYSEWYWHPPSHLMSVSRSIGFLYNRVVSYTLAFYFFHSNKPSVWWWQWVGWGMSVNSTGQSRKYPQIVKSIIYTLFFIILYSFNKHIDILISWSPLIFL